VTALIFDMDGVLADTEPLHVRGWDKAITRLLRESGRDSEDLRALSLEERLKLTGMPGLVIAREMVRLLDLGVNPETLLDLKRNAYHEILDQGIAAFPGLLEELDTWTDVPRALATSAGHDEAFQLLVRLGLAAHFHPIITVEDVENPKPAPDCYLLAAKLMGRRPEDCVVIEDSHHGIKAGLASGAMVLAVSPVSLPTALAGVRATFPSTLEALRWLRA